ncbi:phospho-sugar mutase [Austwickia chelonae]|uniref:phospho-sugar mutase n=1 Tax=Austwickia chelonae TaxID=100225 RepID=UPI001F0780E2|nr:phospho-sugar mutase [Austwickia chelonae]
MTEPTLTRRSRRRETPVEIAADDLIAYAREWIKDDPDIALREELEELIAATEAGEAEALADLTHRFHGLLEFGTAGLRGALGAGPNRMNSSVVMRTAAGLMSYLNGRIGLPTVVVGFDARLASSQFVRDTASVVVGAGGRALVLPRPLPTPVLAYAVRHLCCDAGVMVTGGHNPALDNGYKVYAGDGAQIAPPMDSDIRRHIERVRRVVDIPQADDGWEVLGDEVASSYVHAVSALVPVGAPRDLRIVHTSLHGVAGETFKAVLHEAGFPAPAVVAEQDAPDPSFPTMEYPSPDEPGALDLAITLARAKGADIVLAHDPDGDRCAVAVPDLTVEEGWRKLRGDEVGALLVWDAVQRGVQPGEVFARSLVSSRLFDKIVDAAGCAGKETLTGSKWVSRVEGLRLGYEESSAFCLAPQVVRDEDGISAGLLIAALAARLKDQGRTLTDVLDELETTHGVHATDTFAVRVTDPALTARIMHRLQSEVTFGGTVAGVMVERTEDLSHPEDSLPATEGMRYTFADGSRVVIRPSGTEPKLKVYLETVVATQDTTGLYTARDEATRRLAALRAAFESFTLV